MKGTHPSVLYPCEVYPSRCTDELFQKVVNIVECAHTLKKHGALEHIANRNSNVPQPHPMLTWPGEHYYLLMAVAQQLLWNSSTLMLDIGTQHGHSALSMKEGLRVAEVTTFDVVSHHHMSDSILREDDHIVQHTDNLATKAGADKHADLLKRADLILVDVSHDCFTEHNMLQNFKRIGLKPGCLLFFDDIRLDPLHEFWNVDVDLPKMDLTSFGHWSGTGVALWE